MKKIVAFSKRVNSLVSDIGVYFFFFRGNEFRDLTIVSFSMVFPWVFFTVNIDYFLLERKKITENESITSTGAWNILNS